MSSPKILSQPQENKDLFLYLKVANLIVSLVLVKENEDVQRPMYYYSRTLYDVETWYLKMEKVALVLVRASRKLKSYFQAHQVTILIDRLLRQILHKLELSGCLVKWAIELGEFGLQYESRPTIKG